MKAAEILEQRKTNENFSFEQWLGFLDHEYLTLRFKCRVVRQTGEDCWKYHYDAGMTPMEAILEDSSYS
jgi:hypothetical protein